MTNTELCISWGKFLAEEYNCHPDQNGNYPCDNGAKCDKCTTKEAYKNFCEKNGIRA